MTIITAKNPTTPSFRLAPLALAAMLLSTAAQAGDWRISPSLTARETYSDNIGDAPDGSNSGGFVSEVAPGVSVTGRSRRLRFDGSTEARRYFYHNSDTRNTRSGDLRYRAQTQSELVDEYFYLDAAASGTRQTISPFGTVSGSGYSSLNNTNVRTWSVSPYYRHQFGTTVTAVVRLTRDSVTTGERAFGDTTGTTRSASLTSGSRFADLGWNLSTTHQEISSSQGGQFMTENSVLGTRLRVTRNLALTATGLYDKYDYPALNQSTRGPGWLAGFIWTPSPRTSVDLSVGHRYFGNTGALEASHRSRNTTWRLRYVDDVTMTRSQFLQPTAIDTTPMLDSLLLFGSPDAILRQQALQDYINSTGMPQSLNSNINFLTNRFLRNKRLQGSALLRGARTNVTFTVFRDQRRALSIAGLDNPLLGVAQSSLYDNTNQRGVDVAGDYRLSGHTTAHARLYVVRVQAVTTNLVNNITQVSFGASNRIDPRTVVSLDVRHSASRADAFNNDRRFNENAIVAALSIRY
jgi:uncharacterized protein (PEP-CTERM system associated)